MDRVLRNNMREEINRLVDRLSDSKLYVITEILKGMQDERYGGLSDNKRDAIAKLVDLLKTPLDVGIPEIREIVAPIAKQHNLKRVYLFGSRARGDNRPDSDYDFIVSFGETKGLFAYVALVEDLEEAFFAHVDVLTDSGQKDHIFETAEKDKVLIYKNA